MAHHQKKKNKLSNEKPIPTSWPNLPQPLIKLIVAQPNLMQNITSFGCVTKTWRSPSKKCGRSNRWPRLVEITAKERVEHLDNTRSHICAIKFHAVDPYPYWSRMRKEYMPISYCPGIYFKGHSQGHLVVMAANMSDCYLWEPSNRHTYTYLPVWNPNLDFKLCTWSSPPKYRGGCSMMVLTGSSSPAFAFHRFQREKDDGERGWIMEDCNIKERYDDEGKNMQFSNAIGFEGKFYALSLQGSVVVIEEVGSCFRVTGVGGNRAVPSKVSRQFREFLVECDGEILVVFLVSKKWIDVVDDVEVFRLDVGELLWVKMEGIGDRALFVEDECCMGVDANKVGCRKNSVYFTHHGVENWWVFDMGTANISPLQEPVMWDQAILELE
ncbi:hypothetical protein C2S53_006529 [Perilla frutescens var. hirtella]|uniref:KIB1-4 beta-propeller domain-containing protein n=1 Tax=Perilla frutescens var. hirtella TaxID=608512 RepID=A0AAD4IXX7_PERFH|nr:hypothetical protein C2S53_006529 [Perilla frutescens var. hirtella]